MLNRQNSFETFNISRTSEVHVTRHKHATAALVQASYLNILF